MSDHLTRARRSWNMSRIRATNTKPEIAVRRILHRLGYRFRVHALNLRGKPDIVLPRHRVVLFVHGCFWHRHHCCKFSTTPKTNRAYWQRKFAANRYRDRRHSEQLTILGWKTIVVWECQINSPELWTTTLSELLRQR